MFYASFSTLFGILVFCSETETAAPEFSLKPSNPSYAVEGEDFILEWTFTLDGSLLTVKFSNVTEGADDSIGSRVGPGKINSTQKYEARFSAQATSTKAELTILAVQLSDEGTYKLTVVSSSATFISDSAKVIVHSPPSNIITSSDQTIIAPTELTLNCAADGKPTPTITWTRVSDSTVVYMPLNISGGKNEESYRCTADNVVRKPLAKVVNITIFYKPDSVSLNTPAKVCAGTTVTFKCSAGAANPAIQNYTLYKFVAGLANSSTYNQVGVFNETLPIEGLYNYICEASNSVGNTPSQNRTVVVQVNGSVKIAKSPIHVKEGASVSVHCSFSGFHSQHVSWINTSNDIVEAGNILKFTNISRRYHGGYSCSASNVCGGDSKRVFIDVQYPVEATRKGQNYYYVLEGTSKTLTCPVGGNPEPNITWYNTRGAPVSSGKELKAGKSDCYICVANNSIGTTVKIRKCLIFRRGIRILGQLTIGAHYMEEYRDLNSSSSIIFVAEFVGEMNRRCVHLSWYIGTEVTNLSFGKFESSQGSQKQSGGSVIVEFILYIATAKTEENRLEKLEAAISAHDTFGRYKARHLILPSSKSTTFTTPGSPKSTVSAGPPWAIIGAVAGGVLLLAVLVGVLTWWVHKQRKCRKDTKIHSDVGRHDDEAGYSQVQGAYAQSGPPAANGTDGAAGQEIEVAAAIPTYAVVDKSRKKKKLREEVPAVYAEVDKSKKEKQEAAAIPTYAAVDRSKKKKKACEEVHAVYAEVEKSKKKKKKTNDKNSYENLDETKKEKKPGELLYADLGDFQNPAMPTVCISPQPLPAIKKADPYERTDYADITQFLKGNATLPPNDGNGDTEMKPKRPSKPKIQGNDTETPI